MDGETQPRRKKKRMVSTHIVAGWIEESALPEGIMLRHWRNNWK